MSSDFLAMMGGGTTVVVKHRTVAGQDRQGNDVWGWTVTTLAGIFAPKGSIELVGKTGDSVVTTDQLYLPASTVLTPEDEVIVAGVTYQVDGAPSRWDNPFTGDTVLRADLKVVTG